MLTKKDFQPHPPLIFFDLNESITWKGVNRKIKQIKRTAYGYRKWLKLNLRFK
ncbi:transposase [Liquorilactobacillus satsumensis]|uniref:transposase n=1 Tax=Liquorilactobacillus TaxID=2767888 RepID=UPI002A132379|nr:transposase [Liquorilactobacillus satsumensis]MCP9371465.1 transposase [Liquorilactobacillus satsumensis]